MATRKSASKTVSPKTPVAARSAPVAAASPVVASTPVRNSAVPPKASAPVAKKLAPTYDQIAIRAYDIWRSGAGASQDQNWLRAEAELKGL